MSQIARLEDEGRVEALRENLNHIHVFAFADGRRPQETLIQASLKQVDAELPAPAPAPRKAKAKPKAGAARAGRSPRVAPVSLKTAGATAPVAKAKAPASRPRKPAGG